MSENLHLIIMVKSKKGFNWKARSQISGSVDLSQAKLLEDKLENNGKQKSRTGGGFEVCIAFLVMRRARPFNFRVASDTSFKEGYFFGAFSILPDTSFLLWS